MIPDKMKSYAFALEKGIDVNVIDEYEIQITVEDVSRVRVALEQLKGDEYINLLSVEVQVDDTLNRGQVYNICKFLYLHGEHRETIENIAKHDLSEDKHVTKDPYSNFYYNEDQH